VETAKDLKNLSAYVEILVHWTGIGGGIPAIGAANAPCYGLE
jgi:hypothetical protein